MPSLVPIAFFVILYAVVFALTRKSFAAAGKKPFAIFGAAVLVLLTAGALLYLMLAVSGMDIEHW